MKKTWLKLDHHLWQALKTYRLEKQKVIVALSGGVDSLALAQSFYKVLGEEQVLIAHFHHGGKSPYRDQARNFCRQFAESRNLQWIEETWQGPDLVSEAKMREARYAFLLKAAQKYQCSVIATAHQAQDVLETRLLRLIRGTGAQGLKAIHSWRAPFFRPFLDIHKAKLSLYLNKENLKALTDPSNQDKKYFRNWLRNTWLPQLEAYSSGSCASLGRSLESITQNLKTESFSAKQDFLLRAEFLAQTDSEQRRCLAALLLHKGQKNFTQFHLDEIKRRVLGAGKTDSFKVAGCLWRINAEQIQVQPLPK